MKESERARAGERGAIAILVIGSGGAEGKSGGRPRPRRPIMQNGPRLLKATLPFADDGGSANGDNVNAFTLNGIECGLSM